jgi:alkanesulfonate monooxygenase SsuD/methylene tetrahydromethanopterin reductase-like flavin-dependent oxidoreductase (luciferase family)
MLRKKTVLAIVGLTGLVACGPPPPPLTPVQIAANQWAGAEVAVARCSGYIGGFSDAQALKAEAAKDLKRARNLGATDATLNAAKTTVLNRVNGAIFLIGVPDTCSQLVASLGTADN